MVIAVSIIDFTDALRLHHSPTQFRRLRLRYHVEEVARRLQELRQRHNILQFAKERRQLQCALFLLLDDCVVVIWKIENLLVKCD